MHRFNSFSPHSHRVFCAAKRIYCTIFWDTFARCQSSATETPLSPHTATEHGPENCFRISVQWKTIKSQFVHRHESNIVLRLFCNRTQHTYVVTERQMLHCIVSKHTLAPHTGEDPDTGWQAATAAILCAVLATQPFKIQFPSLTAAVPSNFIFITSEYMRKSST